MKRASMVIALALIVYTAHGAKSTPIDIPPNGSLSWFPFPPAGEAGSYRTAPHSLLPLSRDTIQMDLLDRAGYASTYCSARCGDRLYVGAGAALVVYDLTQPDFPVFLDHLYTRDIIWNMCVRGDTAFIADGMEGLVIVDCSIPGHFSEVGWLENGPAGYAYGIHVQGGCAYLADGLAGLMIIGISDPAGPRELARYVPGDGQQYLTMDVQVQGQIAYSVSAGVASSDPSPSLLSLIDVSNPNAPDTIRTHQTGLFGFTSPQALQVDPDSTVYVANGLSKDLIIFDCSDPASIEELGYFHRNLLMGLDVAVTDDRIFLADSYRYSGVPNFFVFDKSDIGPDMQPAAEYTTLDVAWGVSASGDLAYVSDEWGGLLVLDCSSPSHITMAGRLDLGGYDQEIALSGDRVYVAARGGKVRVFDKGDSDDIEEIAVVHTEGPAFGIDVISDTLFVAEGYDLAQGPAGLEIICAADPDSPQLLGALEFGYDVTSFDLCVIDSVVYLANGTDGLRIIDARDRTDPSTLRIVDTPGVAQDVFVDGDYAYVADMAGGLRIIDIRDPAAAHEINSIDTGDSTHGVWVDGGIACLADGNCGLRIIDCTVPSSPQELGSTPVRGTALRVQVADSLAFVTSVGGGISAFDITVPDNPRETGWFETTGKAYGVQVIDTRLYVTDWYGGLFLIEYSKPLSIEEGDELLPADGGLSLEQNHPNPFNPITDIEFLLPSDGAATLAIFSPRGRKMATLLDGRLSVGAHQLIWDGRDAEGRPLPGGTYFYRLTFRPEEGEAGMSITRKLSLLP
jgi:hypothetical protein